MKGYLPIALLDQGVANANLNANKLQTLRLETAYRVHVGISQRESRCA